MFWSTPSALMAPGFFFATLMKTTVSGITDRPSLSEGGRDFFGSEIMRQGGWGGLWAVAKAERGVSVKKS